jgi:hypothetical protein
MVIIIHKVGIQDMKFFKPFTILSALILLILAFALPAAAQYDQDDIEQAECVHLEVKIHNTGQYIFIFLYQDQFNALLNGGFIPEFTIQVTEPNTTLVYNLIIPPQTLVFITTPSGLTQAFMFEDGQFFALSFGSISASSGDMDTDCLGAARDGRINRFDQQMLAAMYPDANGGYDIWAIDPATSEGSFDYNVSRAQVDAALAAADSSAQAQLIASGTSSTLYALGNGECQLNSPNAGGEMQSFVFACAG